MSDKTGLARVLSLFDLSMLSSASMGPAYSLASTMGLMVAAAGSATPLVLVLLAACMGCVCFSYASLSRQYPNAGSSYAWILQAFGPRIGAFGAWVLFMANIFAVLATAIPAGTYTLALLQPKLVSSPLTVAAVGASWVIVSGILLATGMRPTAGVTAILLIGELIVLVASSIVAALRPAAIVVHASSAQHGLGLSLMGFMTAMVLAIWVVDGWELSAATSEEAHHAFGPGLGGIFALVITTLTLLIAMVAYLHFIAPGNFVAHETDAMALVGERLGGFWTPTIVITVLVSTSASLWTTILYLTRSLYAMGRDGMIPLWFAHLERDATPRRALLFVTISTAALTLVGASSTTVNEALGIALSGSGVFLGLLFVGAALAALKLVRQGQHWALGIAVPLIGAVSIGILCVGQVLNGDLKLRFFALTALVIGIPFALWRATAIAKAPRTTVRKSV